MIQTAEHKKILTEAKERFTRALSADESRREHYSKNMRFISGDQWTAEAKTVRQGKRPMLVMNRLRTFAAILCGEQRQNEIGGRVIPRGNGANDDTANVLAGKIRDIESESEAEVANDKSFKDCIEGNMGWQRVTKEYVSETSFDQKLVIEPIEDSLSVVCDESAVRWDRSDMLYLFKFRDYGKYEFETRYPDAEIDPFAPNMTVDNSGWSKGDAGVQVAEYWRVVLTKSTVCLYADGRSFWKDDKRSLAYSASGMFPIKEREGIKRKVEQYIINGCEVLEENDWDGSWIPFIPVVGDERWVDGKRVIFSAISHSHDAQRMVNWYATGEAESASLAPLPTWVGYVGQFKTDRKKWADPAGKYGYRQADLLTVDGKQAPLPKWEAFTPPTEAFLAGKAAAVDDVKATMGMSDALTGMKETDQSGKAIEALKQQGNTANFNFFDNLVRAVRHRTRILVELIPKTYDTPRDERIIDKDKKEKIVRFNEQFIENGKAKAYMLAEGDYGVAIDVGPSNQTQQQQDSEDLNSMATAAPDLFPRYADLFAEAHPGPIWKRIAERVKPPDVKDEEDQEGQQIPKEAQELIQAAEQKIKAQDAAMAEMSQVIETKQIEANSKKELEDRKLAQDYEIETEKLKLEWAKLELEAQKIGLESKKIEADVEKARFTAIHSGAMKAMELDSKESEGEASREHALVQQDKTLQDAAQSRREAAMSEGSDE